MFFGFDGIYAPLVPNLKTNAKLHEYYEKKSSAQISNIFLESMVFILFEKLEITAFQITDFRNEYFTF